MPIKLNSSGGGSVTLNVPSTAIDYSLTLPVTTGIIPGLQLYRLNSAYAGSNATGSQNIFPYGVTLVSGKMYNFEAVYSLSKSAGVTSHTFALVFGGTATLNNISYAAFGGGSGTYNTVALSSNMLTSTQASATVFTGNQTNASNMIMARINGSVSVNSGGSFIPQYALSAAPGGAYSTGIGSYFAIYPIGDAGADVSVGSWS